MNNYDIIYLLSNVFGTYIIWKFMCLFFNRSSINFKIESVSYILYFVGIGFIYIYFETPMINVISNLILFFLLTLNYPATWKLRLSAIAYIYAVLICSETFTISVISILNLNKYLNQIDIELILSFVLSKIVSFIALLIVSNFKMLKAKSNINISLLHWCAVFIIPLGTLFSTFILMTVSSQDNFIFIFFSISIIFTINFYVFYLYDNLLQSYEEKMESALIKQQNKAIIKQLKIINLSQDNLKLLRHDMKLHMATLHTLIEKKNNTDALNYIQRIFSSISYVNEFATSGNIEIDSILNYKLNEAKKEQIKIAFNMHIPSQLNIHSFDLVTILGNLLDNAIEAASKSTTERRIELTIELRKNILYINLINTFCGELICINDRLVSTRIDKKNHGLGLKSVQNSLEKYNGAMNKYSEKNTFHVNVLLYNK